ncbi:MAG: inosine/xanthosine triphosphatase [Nanoarchaeota archaeon]|nr:inosine/xanthosine triphosphatase [Nanoarchaeota archaeon]
MRINVGSKNQVKVDAVKEIIKDYDFLSEAEVFSLEVTSGVYKQPTSTDETIQGAMNRAKSAFQNCKYSFGIESGLITIPNTKTGYMNICACAIYDGKDYHLGLSSAFEYPTKVTKLVFSDNLEIDEAIYKAGLTRDKRIGRSGGVIGYLTKNRLKRKEYIKQAITTALIHLENPELFK